MTSQEIAERVESDEVCFDVGLASTTGTLCCRIDRNPVLEEVLIELLADAEGEKAVHFLCSAMRLYDSNSYPGFAHPRDHGLAAYLRLLQRLARSLGEREDLQACLFTRSVRAFTARVAREEKPEFWRSVQLAQLIMGQRCCAE